MRYRANLARVDAVQLPVKVIPEWLANFIASGAMWSDGNGGYSSRTRFVQARRRDWIIRLPNGVIRVCDPALFAAVFELIE